MTTLDECISALRDARLALNNACRVLESGPVLYERDGIPYRVAAPEIVNQLRGTTALISNHIALILKETENG